MENIRFSTLTLAGFGVSGTLMIMLAVMILIVWKKKTKASYVPIIAGAVTFVVSAFILEQIPLLLLMVLDSPVSQTINSSVWLKYLVGAILAGVFEETGRFVTYRFFLKKYAEKQTAISYGIGHAGIECIIIGFSTLSFIVLGVIVNSGNSDMILQGMEGAQLETALAQIESYAAQTLGTSILCVWERVSAIMLQISTSMLVFRAVRDKKCRWMYPLSILLHAAIDFCIAFYQADLISLLVLEIMFMALSAAVFIPAYRFVYKPMPEVMST